LGVEPWQRFPVLLHLPALYEHTSILGRSGSGKTSMGMMQLLIQVIRSEPGGEGAGNDAGRDNRS
jgi:ABC-type phosphate/phosphonate transport system ATPase subunit